MTTAQISEILRLPVEERMALMDVLWDSVLQSVERSPHIPDWHKAELDRRMAAASGLQPAGREWGVVEKDLRARIK